MASGSQLMTTYYAKRIIGDNAATTSSTALLQSGVQASMWIFGHERSNYGIKYLYDNNEGKDKIEFHGNAATATAWVQLDTGDISFGTVKSGTWNGSTIGVAYGGTGKTSWTQWGVLYASTSTTLTNTGAGTAGYLLQSNASSAPTWIQATNTNTSLTIVKRDNNGDFSAGTITANLVGGATFTEWVYLKNDDDAPRIYFGSSENTSANGGFIYMSMGQTNNVYRPSRYNFRIFSYNSSTGATDSSHYETYSLPQVTPDRADSKTYNILTDKDLSFSITGNAGTATKLQTARAINGTNFDGSAAITTAKWGTARNITIKDADSTNAGTAVSVDGSTAITLLLPSTIKASLSGNATSASSAAKLTNAKNIWGQSFDGTANITGHFTMGNTSSRYHYFYINQHGTTNLVGSFRYDSGSNSNVTTGRWQFAEYSPNTTNDNTTTGFAEVYRLPAVDTGLDEDKTYNILTSKSLGFSITGNAATATALTTDAGNSNTPVYFSGGKPVATNNKLGAVNANGYWGMRGADNGDSWIRTTSSGIIPVQSGGAGSGHCGLGTSSWYFSSAYIDNVYGKLHGDCTGSSGSCTGNAATATKLGTATVGGSNRPIYLNAGTATAVSWYHNSCSINGGNTANYPWHRFATCTTGTGQYVDKSVIVIFHARFSGGRYGAIKLGVRTNASGAAMSSSAVWLYRYGFSAGDVKITTGGTTGTDTRFNAWVKCATWPRTIAYILEGSNNGWSLISSNEPDNCTAASQGTEINASVSGADAADGATVSYANSAGSASTAAACSGNAATATALGSNAGGTEQPIYFTGGKPAATSYSLKANISNSTAGYMAYYSADRTITGISNIRSTSAGSLSVFPVGGSYRDGIRIHARTTDNTWSGVVLCGADNTGDSGTSANTWFIGNNNGDLYFGRNGTGSSGTYLRCVSNTWAWNGTATGSISGSSGSLSGGLTTNDVTTHGNLKVTTAKGSYYGINLGGNASGMSIMSINASHQGLYNQTNGQWILYYNAASNSKSIVLGNSTINVTGGISLNLNTKVTGTLTISSHCYFANGTTYYINSSGTGNLNALTVNATTASSSTATGALIVKGGIGAAGNIYGSKVFGAVWNDYAEYREVETEEPGYCVTETKDRRMIKTTKRLQPGCKITSDTFGICMGQTNAAKTPIAVAGRVLVYPYRNPIHYQLGDAVCSAPNGTVDIMTRDEIMMYPERIVGTVSEIPDYEVWHSDVDGKEEIQVNGRIWIYVR